jgi:hypothetical protein
VKLHWIAIGVLSLVALGLKPVVRASSDRLAVAIAAHGEIFPCYSSWGPAAYALSSEPDPWGKYLIAESSSSTGEPLLYSAGPNGDYERGHGDDVVPTQGELAVGAVAHAAPQWGASLALLVAWLTWGPFTRKPRAPHLVIEALRALALASGPTVFVYVALEPFGLGPFDSERWIAFGKSLGLGYVVPVEAALAGSWLAVGWLAALGWRLRRPLESET